MKAIVMENFGDTGVLKYTSRATQDLAAGEVRVRLESAGVNPAETYIRSGEYAFFRPPLPCTLGFDGAGRIAELASGARESGLTVGDRVFVSCLLERRQFGTYAEELVCGAASVHPLPEHLTFDQGAAVGVPTSTAWRAVHQLARVQSADIVLVHGASGAVGLSTVQLARATGATVIGTAGSWTGEAAVRTAGASYVLRHDVPGYLERLRDITGGRGVNAVIEMLANVNLESDLLNLAQFGRIVVVGSRGSLDITPRQMMIKEATVMGTALWNCRVDEWSDILTGVAQALAAKTVMPVVGQVFELANASDAHRFIAEHPATGKVVLNCGEHR